MIPDDVRRKVWNAFWVELGRHGTSEGFDAALAILDAAWPQTDARANDLTDAQMAKVKENLRDRGWVVGPQDEKDIRDAFRAALSPPQPAATVRLWTAKDIAEYEQRLSIVKEAFARFEAYDPQPAAPRWRG